jgi:predicted transcriptional regulator
MTTTLVELTANIVTSHASGTKMSGEELLQEIDQVFAALKQLETGTVVEEVAPEPTGPALTFWKAFQADQVCCMICGKTGFKTLTRHLKQAHNLRPGQYRKQFNIPSSQSLTAENYSETRRKAANEGNLAANLEKARAVRAAKKAPPVVAPTPTVVNIPASR